MKSEAAQSRGDGPVRHRGVQRQRGAEPAVAQGRKEECTLAANGHPDNGLGHPGEPEEEEVIVVEEPEGPGESGPQVVRAPRVPTQKEIEAHGATHIPHELSLIHI